MRVLNISTADNANFAHDNARALISVGVDCEDVKTSRHPFRYNTESAIMSIRQITDKAREFDVLQIFHSEPRILQAVRNLGKTLVVYNTGSIYRVNPTAYNNLFNPYVSKTISALGELVDLGAKNETYIVGAIDVPPLVNTRTAFKFAHYPSNAKVKGTAEITKAMVGYDFHYNTDIVKFSTQLLRMQMCRVYIELFKPELNGKPYGSFGITALEAAAMGKVVVTQNLSKDVYTKYYGECPLILCDTLEAFKTNIKMLDELSDNELRALQLKTYDWVERNHSYNATGLRIKSILDGL